MFFAFSGYGHVTPQTQYGKLLTMLYAVIGIPLFFSYLSKNGDMMASLFRLVYARGCKPVFRMMGRRRRRRKKNLFTSMQSLASIANLDAEMMRPSREVSVTSATSGKLRRNQSSMSYLTIRDESSPPLSIDGKEMKKGVKGKRSSKTANGGGGRSLKRSLSTRSLRELRRNALSAPSGAPIAPLLDTMTFTLPNQRLPPGSSLDSAGFKKQQKLLAGPQVNTIVLSSSINGDNGSNVNGLARKVIIHNKTKPVQEDKRVNVPISLTLCMMFIYILIGATVFCMWENTDYIKWSYFCFVTLSTIGFGDIVPGKNAVWFPGFLPLLFCGARLTVPAAQHGYLNRIPGRKNALPLFVCKNLCATGTGLMSQ